MVSKRHAPFRAKYGVELGLRVKERDPDTQQVVTAACLFCELFGRESKPGAVRRATEKVAVFKPPFRRDSIQIHHVGQHPTRWAEYCALSSSDSKRAYFIAAGATTDLNVETSQDNGRPRKTARVNSTLNCGATSAVVETPTSETTMMHWLVDRDIVSVVIGVMLPYAADPTLAGQTYQLQAVADFDDMMDPSEVRSGAIMDAARARYRVLVRNPTQFLQFVEYLSTSGSLTNSARMLHVSSRPAPVGPFFDGDVLPIDMVKYARFLCAINFQRIAAVVKRVGVFSIGLKVAPIAPASFFDAQVEYCLHLQVRAFVDGEVTGIHVLSIPLNKRRRSDPAGSTGVFEIAELALNAIIAQWQDTMLAVVSDSDAIVALESEDPRLSLRNAVASRFMSVAKSGFLHVCCAARQLDALMQKVFTRLLGGDELYSKVTALVSYLSRQHVLLTAMKTSVPSLSDNRWRSRANTAMWFRRYGVSIREHLQKELAGCTPPDSWWIRMMLAARIGQEATPLLDEISGFTTETSAPREAVVKLRSFLMSWFNVSGPLEIDDPAVAAAAARSGNDNSATSRDGKYSVNTNDVFSALEDLGTFIAETLKSAENDNEASQSVVKTTVKEIATGVVNLVSGLTSITIDIDGIGATLSDLPAVLPHELVKLRGRQFAAILRPQMERLRFAGWTRQEIDWIEQDFQDLCGAYARESSLKLALDSHTSKSSFRDAWHCLQGRFMHLQRFCGLMATAHPVAVTDCTGTSSTSMVGCNSLAPVTRVAALPGDIESGVSDLSVQAALHAKQFQKLQALQL
ncbi:hypothetical protein KRP22_007188 [Phytophthora ramorum]|nr:hypothetical protein KRP22_1715 [Phytophthora ramorum]